jgi:hypothetical protein
MLCQSSSIAFSGSLTVIPPKRKGWRPVPDLERHLTVTEIAEQWNVSYSLVRRIFLGEPGVLKFGGPSRLVGHGKYKRRYFTLRVPESVLLAVQQRLSLNRKPALGVTVPRLLNRKGAA